jgi:WD40 repeat protein
MATSRRHFPLYTLSDGRVLVVGGTDTSGADGSASVFYETAEIYDPAAGTWTATGSLTTGGRALHTASRLPDGRILITGGWNGAEALSTAEIYNPAAGTFSATGSMSTGRANHRARVLFDGRILVAGGFDSKGAAIASAEIYDPASGTFSATAGPMSEARFAHSLNPVGDGKVLASGGFGTGGLALGTAELFDPVTGTFLPAGSLAHPRAHHNAVGLPSGKVLLIGGHGGGGVLGSTEIYDPEANTFAPGPALNQARQNPSAYLLPNGLVLVSGGNNNASAHWDIQTNFLSSAELFNPAPQIFTATGSKKNATCNGNSVLLWTGKFLNAGGGTNEAELYTPEMPGTPATWVAAGNMVSARTGHLSNLLDDGRVLITGGLNAGGNPTALTELYDYLTGNFSPTGSMKVARQHHRSVLLYNGKVLVTGGRPNSASGVLDSAELYDPVSGTFSLAGNMLRYRRLHRLTPLPNGKILITGGLGGMSDSANNLMSLAEIYDPATGSFTPAPGNMITPRRGHQTILLHTGKVLIAGGYGSGGLLLNAAELYDPDTGTFSATGNMITARVPFLNRLPNGKILVSCGSDSSGTPIRALEIYDPATGAFTAAGNLLVGRDGGRVILLDNGKEILIGGQTTADAASVTETAEVYNHLTGRVSPTGSLVTGRRDFVHNGLPNGRILVAGGITTNGAVLSSAEVYTPLIADVFSDIPLSYWAYDYIMAIYSAQITAGCTQEPPAYCPEASVTREQMAVFLIRALNQVPQDGYCGSTPPFADVAADRWSCKYIRRLVELGITSGIGEGLFGPEGVVTREQMAAFLTRALDEVPSDGYCGTVDPFTDVPYSGWSCKYVKKLVELGITVGIGEGLYGPGNPVTRAQMAVFLSRAFLGM